MKTRSSGRSRALAAIALSGLVVLGLTACGNDDDSSSETTEVTETTEATEATETTEATEVTETTAAAAASMGAPADLVDAAKAEGKVNLIALPDTWANYKGILASFRDKYDIENPVANPDASSADELTAIKTLKGQPDMPDAIDVGPSFATQAVQEGLITPYKPSSWDEIPDALKDPDGNWVGAYYGIMAIATNKGLVPNVPRSFADLLKPEFKGKVAMNGDPREAGAAFAAVMAASLANGGTFDDITPGIDYFAKLKSSGNLVPVDVNEANILSGETPIVLDWTYNFPGLLPKLKEAGVELEVVVPTDGVYGSYYAQAVVAGSPHQNAAKLWIEHILSDEGAMGYLEGGAIPARYAALLEAGKVSDDLKKNLPSQDLIASIAFPSQAQVDAAKKALTDQWATKVAGN